MVNWRTYRITGKGVSSGSYCYYSLDGYVYYNYGSNSYQGIYCKDYSPFNCWHEGDYIEIDNDQTRCYSYGSYYFGSTSQIRHICHHHGCHGCCDHGTSEALKRAEDRNNSLISQNSSLQSQLSSKSTEAAEKDKQVAIVSGELTTTKTQLSETKGALVTKTQQLDTLTGLFNNLKIEGNNKDKDLEIKSKNIKDLNLRVSELEEKDFDYRLKEKEKELDELIQQLEIGRKKPRELRRAYQQLFKARENYNRDNIEDAENKIEDIKDELIEGGININDFQKLCSKCEKFAILKIEQSKIQDQKWRQQQEQYEACQEVLPLPRNN